ncbi:unnamed protein product [Trifolium pratense]|nr:unnamed protein product [Trifolium pratense]
MARNLQVSENIDTPENVTINNAHNCIIQFKQATNMQQHIDQGAFQQRQNHQTTNQNRHWNNPNPNKKRNQTWHRPNQGNLKANSDANLSKMGTWNLGAIIRGEYSEPMVAGTLGWTLNRRSLWDIPDCPFGTSLVLQTSGVRFTS